MFLLLSSILIMQNTTSDLTAGGIKTERPKAIYASPSIGNWNPASQAIDDNFLTSYITNQTNKEGKRVPHYLTLSYDSPRNVHGFVYIPDPYRNPGRIRDFSFYVTNDSDYTKSKSIFEGTFPPYDASFWPSTNERFHTIWLPKPVKGDNVTLVSHNDHANSKETAFGELVPIFNPDNYRYKHTSMGLLKGYRMAPSVHLAYNNKANDLAQEADLYYLEMTPKKSASGTYFMSIGFNGGYFGIQEQSNNNKVVIFSVWDSANTNNKHDVALDQRVRAIYVDSELVIRRFGGEGVGVQTFLDYDWKVDETYKFALRFDPCSNDDFGVFTAYFFDNKKDKWRQLASLALPYRHEKLTGFHSFVEDFKRNFYSFNNTRCAEYSNIWAIRSKDKKWIPITTARFTIDSNPQRNVDAGKAGENRAFLATGGSLNEKTNKVYNAFKFNDADSTLTPPKLPDFILHPSDFKVLKFQEVE